MHAEIKNHIWLGFILLCLSVASCSRSGRVDNRSPASQTPAGSQETSGQGREQVEVRPLVQGNSLYDRHLTARIREAILSGPVNYSPLANNIDVITCDGTVTLRGSVRNEKERNKIVTIAKGIAGNANVNNLLDLESNRQSLKPVEETASAKTS